MLWLNIGELNDEPDVVQKCISIHDINLVVDGISMFHYYAGNAEIIETFQKCFEIAKATDATGPTGMTLPL